MWPFKKKIKETKKVYPYRNRVQSTNYSAWDSLSIIEKFCLITLPCLLCFIFWMICDVISPDLKWWYRLPISVGITTGLIVLLTAFINWMVGEN